MTITTLTDFSLFSTLPSMKKQAKSTLPGALWGTTKALGNLFNNLVNILLGKDVINTCEITVIKDPICLKGGVCHL